MTTMVSSPTLLFYGILILFLGGVVTFTWGRKLPLKGEWILWLSIFGVIGVGIFDSGIVPGWELSTKVWEVGWVWPRTEIGALTIGLVQDSLGIVISLLAATLTGVTLLNRGNALNEERMERTYAALAFSTAGVALAWISLTPWLAFVGLELAIFGGFLSYGSRWDQAQEANTAVRLLKIWGSGFLIALAGSCILASSSPELLFTRPENWLGHGGQLDSKLGSSWVGSILLVTGLFIQIQSFPLLEWLIPETDSLSQHRVLLTQIFPAWAGFALFFRLEPQFSTLGLFPGFGWVGIGFAVLAMFTGLFQTRWSSALRIWLASGFSLSVAILAFSGSAPSFGMLLGMSLGAFGIAGAASSLQIQTRTRNDKQSSRAICLKVLIVLGVAAGTGLVGFVSARSGFQWILSAMANPVMVIIFLLCFCLFAILGWKIAWMTCRMRVRVQPSLLSILSPAIGICLATGILWTGTLTGGNFLNNSDRVMGSLFDVFFGNGSSEFSKSPNFIPALSLYWSVLILAVIAAYWLSGRKEDKWDRFAVDFPRLSGFIASGYYADHFLQRTTSVLAWLGKGIETAIDENVWFKWTPRGLFFGIRKASAITSEIDIKASQCLNKGLRVIVEVPAKLLQLIQTGDLRWYLIFALSSGFAMLLHFLYFLNR